MFMWHSPPVTNAPAVTNETPTWWCPECEQGRPTTFTFARERNPDGTRLATSAVCDRGHSFSPYE
ncbi:MAG: hypothetical protein JWR55_554 [Aeromicrobium sp.]|jgi:hypothetical protein|nr:hypothetical protein [Aeromicrobium sp.]